MLPPRTPFLFCGSSHVDLGKDISKISKIPLGRISLSQFPDGEVGAEILEDVRGRDVFLLQTIALNPNFYLMEALIIIDALKRASAKNIMVILPYFGYCRQDRKDKPGMPITAKLVANLLTVAGATRLITVDLHAGQIEGFFEIPVDHLHCQKMLGEEARKIIGNNTVVVAPDIGSIKIAKKMAELLGCDLAMIEKQRESSHEVKMTMIGNVKNKNVLITDDMCSTGETLVKAAYLCKEHGALKILGAVTHALCVENAIEKIEKSPLEILVTTNTIPTGAFNDGKKVKVLSIAPLIAETLEHLLKDYFSPSDIFE